MDALNLLVEVGINAVTWYFVTKYDTLVYHTVAGTSTRHDVCTPAMY